MFQDDNEEGEIEEDKVETIEDYYKSNNIKVGEGDVQVEEDDLKTNAENRITSNLLECVSGDEEVEVDNKDKENILRVKETIKHEKKIANWRETQNRIVLMSLLKSMMSYYGTGVNAQKK